MDWSPSHVVQGIDLTELKHTLDGINYTAVKKQKALYSRLYHEANVTHHSGKGISFTEMLLLLAHYKLIVDRDALVYVCYRVVTRRLSRLYPSRLKDLVVRTETNKLVTDLVNLDRVRSLLKMIIYRRRFKDHIRRLHEQGSPFCPSGEMELNSFVAADIPSIIVENTPTTPPNAMRDIAGSPLSIYGEPETPSPSNRDSRASDLANIRQRSSGLQRRSRAEASYTEFSPSHRDTLSMGDVSTSTDADDILFSMQNSVWGGESHHS